jgi:hypothetical protein
MDRIATQAGSVDFASTSEYVFQLMTFLNPFALFGLAAAAIPVLLHMLSMRRLRTIEFSSLRFLKELQQTRIRRLKIRQWLLLLLRTLVVMFLVLAFSRPTLQGLFGTASAGQARTTAVILLDDTPSMTATGPDGELFHRARAAAGRIIDLLRDGDEGILVPFSATDAPEVPEPTRSTAILRHTLEGLRTTPKSRTAEQALRVAARIMNVSKNFNKEVFLLSDLQASTLEMNPSAQSEKLFDERTRLFVLPLHAGEVSNASVEQVRLPDAIREPGRPLRVLVRVANHSGREMNNRVVSLFLNGSRVAQRGVDISAGRSAEVEFMATPSQAGWVSGAAEIEEDDLPFDDHRSFAAFIPTAIRVACVGSPSDLQYIEMALSVRLADTLQLLHLTRIDVNRLTRS